MTLPRKLSGVESWIKLFAVARKLDIPHPVKTRNKRESHKIFDMETTSSAAEKHKTATDIYRHLFSMLPFTAIITAAENAPSPVALTNRPSPFGPALNISSANMGRKLVKGIPNRLNTEMRIIIYRISFWAFIKWRPSEKSFKNPLCC